jgi:hypothetical protein
MNALILLKIICQQYLKVFFIGIETVIILSKKKSIIESLMGSVRHNYFYYSGNAIRK